MNLNNVYDRLTQLYNSIERDRKLLSVYCKEIELAYQRVENCLIKEEFLEEQKRIEKLTRDTVNVNLDDVDELIEKAHHMFLHSDTDKIKTIKMVGNTASSKNSSSSVKRKSLPKQTESTARYKKLPKESKSNKSEFKSNSRHLNSKKKVELGTGRSHKIHLSKGIKSTESKIDQHVCKSDCTDKPTPTSLVKRKTENVNGRAVTVDCTASKGVTNTKEPSFTVTGSMFDNDFLEKYNTMHRLKSKIKKRKDNVLLKKHKDDNKREFLDQFLSSVNRFHFNTKDHLHKSETLKDYGESVFEMLSLKKEFQESEILKGFKEVITNEANDIPRISDIYKCAYLEFYKTFLVDLKKEFENHSDEPIDVQMIRHLISLLTANKFPVILNDETE